MGVLFFEARLRARREHLVRCDADGCTYERWWVIDPRTHGMTRGHDRGDGTRCPGTLEVVSSRSVREPR